MAYVARYAVGGFLDQRSPLQLHAVGRRGERQRGDQGADVVTDAGGDAAHADLGLLVVGRPALGLDALELALERGERGERVLGMRGEAGALRVIAQACEA